MAEKSPRNVQSWWDQLPWWADALVGLALLAITCWIILLVALALNW